MQAAIINKLKNSSILGFLETDVSTAEMLKSLNWDTSKLIAFRELRSEKKQKEWLGVRLLLKEILNGQSFDLLYDNQGKPFLANPVYNISISHSGNFVCVLVNRNLEVGVDVQVFKPNIAKGTGLFMSDEELKDYVEKKDAKALHIYWSAKEAIYKFVGLQKTSIKNDIYIFPFKVESSGELKGKLTSGKTINLQYRILNKYTLVYTV